MDLNSAFHELNLDYKNDFLGFNLIYLVVLTVIIFFCRGFYKKIRSRFPVTVNCWFCNRNSKVPYNNTNCWDCPHCDQYNGFSPDGGYNKVITEQFTPDVSTKVYNAIKSAFYAGKSYVKPNSDGVFANGLCRMCNINQELKIQQLANFTPKNEDNFDAEVHEYREQLEKSYSLCSKCQITLNETLKKQKYNLLKENLNQEKVKYDIHKKNVDQFKQKLHWKLISQRFFYNTKQYVLTGLRWSALFLNFWILTTYLYELETQSNILKDFFAGFQLGLFADIPDFILDCILYFTQVLSDAYETSYLIHRELTGLSFMCYLLSSYGRQKRIDILCLIFCGLQHAAAWSASIFLQIFTTGTTLLLNLQSVRTKSLYFKKTVLKEECSAETDLAQVPRDNLFLTCLEETGELNFRTVNNLETKLPDETLKDITNLSENIEKKMDEPVRRTRSLVKQSVLKKKDKKMKKKDVVENDSERENKTRNKRLSSPPPEELFTNLNDLHINTASDAKNKTCNYLFERHNFVDKINKSIIKPSKLGGSWSQGESWNEEVSRSSTPSSGYMSQSSQKPEGSVFPPKSVSPLNLPVMKSQERYDYYDQNRSNFYFNANYNPFSAAAPQFSNYPLGHTVYTYTPSTPCFFPNQKFGAPYDLMYAPKFSNCFSSSPKSCDSSKCNENSWNGSSFEYCSQNQTPTGNHFEGIKYCQPKPSKWSKCRELLYNASVFLNIFSFFIVVYAVWNNWVKLDIKIPFS